MHRPLRAVLFDLDDTLHDDTLSYRRAAQRVAREVAHERGGIDPEHLLETYIAQADSFWQRLDARGLGTPLADLRLQMWTDALAQCGLGEANLGEHAAGLYNRYRHDVLELWPGALELLASLRTRGLKLALITNGFAETHREKIELLALEDAFDAILIADEVGLVKPDPRIFRLAAERLGVSPETCAMVGDRFERDIAGAAAVGMFTVWMNVRGEKLPDGERPPDAVVADVRDVERALRLEEFV